MTAPRPIRQTPPRIDAPPSTPDAGRAPSSGPAPATPERSPSARLADDLLAAMIVAAAWFAIGAGAAIALAGQAPAALAMGLAVLVAVLGTILTLTLLAGWSSDHH